MSRRDLLQYAAAAGALACVPSLVDASPPGATPSATPAAAMMTRMVPRSRETLPAIGLGTWKAFDVTPDAEAPIVEVVRSFFAMGGKLIDSSPMYGKAESVIGDVLTSLNAVGTPFLAGKVWTRGSAVGVAQMEQSRQAMKAPHIDLIQVHNLVDWQTHLPVLREMKASGAIRYLGVTHYAAKDFPMIEQIMRTQTIDFIQVPYNVVDRSVEDRILPAAADTGTAVIVMRPFEEGELHRRIKGKPLPDWAADMDATSWAQVFLKFILANPTVTCAIPATRDPAHLADNMKAGTGRLPDANLRRTIIQALQA
jgi:aryl-alcohol dehydrogenase-like predicted oxidoreductase